MMSAQISYFKNTNKYQTRLIKSRNVSLIYMCSLSAASFSASQLRIYYFVRNCCFTGEKFCSPDLQRI